MKTAIVLSQSEKSELEAFCRRESPLTSYVRSLQMNLATAKGSGDMPNLQGTEGNDAPSLLTGLDLDTLPKEVREALEAKEVDFKSVYNEKKKFEEAKVEAEKRATHFQSLADKRHEKLRQHNLSEDGKQQQTQKTSEESLIEELTADFIKDGMKPEAAPAYAKMFAKASGRIAKTAADDVTTRVTPLAQTVSTMQAAQVLTQAESEQYDPNQILQIPEIRAEVEKQIGFFANQGTVIDVPFVQKLVNMEYGAYVQKNPDAIQNQQQMQQQPPMRLNTGGGGGNYRNTNPPRQQVGNGAPIARDQDTARAFQQTADILLKGIKRK